MHGLHARVPKNFVLEERLERYSRAIELTPEHLRGEWADACWPSIGAQAGADSVADGRDGAAPTDVAVPLPAGGGASPSGRYAEVRLDLGCGKGAFSVESARREPDVLFVAMDSEPLCIARAAQLVCESGVPNVVVVPGNGMRVREFFSPGELSVIYLNFPTPFPRKRDARLRMASMERLMDFREVLASGGEVRLRTDSQPLFDFMLTQVPLAGYEIAWSSRDARADRPDDPTSEYEERLGAQGARVHALTLVPGPAPEHPEQTAELSLAAYLPHDLSELEGLSYAPHGMQATVVNLRNQAHRAASRGRRRAR